MTAANMDPYSSTATSYCTGKIVSGPIRTGDGSTLTAILCRYPPPVRAFRQAIHRFRPPFSKSIAVENRFCDLFLFEAVGVADGGLEVSQEVRQRRAFRSSQMNMPPDDLPGQEDRNGAPRTRQALHRKLLRLAQAEIACRHYEAGPRYHSRPSSPSSVATIS